VIVIAEHRHYGRLERAQTTLELVEELLAMAYEVAGEHDQVRLLRVGELNRRLLNRFCRHAPEMLIGEVRDSHVGKFVFMGDVTRESAQFDPCLAARRGGRELRELESRWRSMTH
jgi:hypothetical protein